MIKEKGDDSAHTFLLLLRLPELHRKKKNNDLVPSSKELK